MSTTELRNKLIERIKQTKDDRLLEEAFRLLEMETSDLEIYQLTEDQKMMVEESRSQIKKGQSQTNEQLDRDIDEWLGK